MALSTGFEAVEVDMHASLPPAYAMSVRRGVHEVLNHSLMKFNRDIGGVLCTYSNVRLPQSGHVFGCTPFIHLRVKLQGLVFRPRRGQQLVGVVNKVGSNHIGLLVAGTFNASISGDHMSAKYSFNHRDHAWVSRINAAERLQVDSQVTFTVLSFHEALGLISVVGALDDGIIAAERETGKKRRRDSGAMESDTNERRKKKSRTVPLTATGARKDAKATAAKRHGGKQEEDEEDGEEGVGRLANGDRASKAGDSKAKSRGGGKEKKKKMRDKKKKKKKKKQKKTATK